VIQAELRRQRPNLELVAALVRACPEAMYLSNHGTGEYPIHVAFQTRSLAAVRTLLGLDPSAWCTRNNKTLEFPLHVLLNVAACHRPPPTTTTTATATSSSSSAWPQEQQPPQQQPSGDDALDFYPSHFAAAVQEETCALLGALEAALEETQRRRQIRDAASKLEAGDCHGRSALHYAAAFHTAQVAERVLRLSPRGLPRSVDRRGDSPLHVACARVSATESLSSVDVFALLARALFHDWANLAGQSPVLLLWPMDLRTALLARLGPLAADQRPDALS